MDKNKIKSFFDGLAAGWDAGAVVSGDKINKIFKNAGIAAGCDVLDVACGTGVLFPFFLQQKVNSITGIDISSHMARIAKEKFAGENITVFNGDAETYSFPSLYDCIIIYDAFPHFADCEKLIRNLTAYLKPDGRLTIAHSMGREKLELHHRNVPEGVSKALLSDDELKKLLAPYYRITVFESDENMIQVVGEKR